MLAGTLSHPGVDHTVAVPVVRSTRTHSCSRLCACIGMAVAFSRGDELGARYRDLLELCMRDQDATFASILATARRLFPDVPVSDYGMDEMEVDDAVMLARMAAQRAGRVLPVFVYDEHFQPEGRSAICHAAVLESFHLDDPMRRTFFDAEPADVAGRRMRSRVEYLPPGFQCLVFGWLPPPALR